MEWIVDETIFSLDGCNISPGFLDVFLPLEPEFESKPNYFEFADWSCVSHAYHSQYWLLLRQDQTCIFSSVEPFTPARHLWTLIIYT